MNEIMKRITSESPTFFKRIQALGITLGAIGAALMTLPMLLPDFVFPPIIDKMSGYFVAIGIVATAIAKTTVKDATVLKKEDAPPAP